MATVLLILVVVLVLAALVFGVVSLLSGDDPGLGKVEPDGRAVALPNNRSLTEVDLKTVRFDLGWRGYRMAQVDRVLRRTAYDVGYKDEMIAVLEAEVMALRDGRAEDAELLRKARESAANPGPAGTVEKAIALDVPASWEISPAASGLAGTASAEPVEAGGDIRVEAVGSLDAVATGPERAAGLVVPLPDGENGLADQSAAEQDGDVTDDDETRLEAARSEAATPGRLAGRNWGEAGPGGASAGKSGRRAPKAPGRG
jgi:DivIVA domain-containing protein